MLGFVIGLIVGGTLGLFAAALCSAAHEGDKQLEDLMEEYDE